MHEGVRLFYTAVYSALNTLVKRLNTTEPSKDQIVIDHTS